uniref:Adenylate kinase isoenzyme 6 n=1 Tax=Cajanus cajan TaxID=3821 RepID=A0A151S053_CAJCA|nr:putative adenylate kinase isoenzyme 6 [Cajanus cajan]
MVHKNGKRGKPIILVTGTPGTGKTTVCTALAEATQLHHINVGELVKENNLRDSWDDELDCYVINEDLVCDELENVMEEGGNIVTTMLKEILAKQAELGVEVAEIPSYYLKKSENQGLQREGRNKFNDKRKFQNKSNKKPDRKGQFTKKQKFADKDSSESPSLKKRKPTLLQKLLSADIKRDKCHLFQVFRFMVVNSFFKHFPDKPLRYPSVLVKEIGSELDGEEKYLHTRKDVFKQENEETVQKIVNLNDDNGHDSEDEDSDDDENDSIVDSNQQKPPSLVKGIEKSDEEEGEIKE